MPGFSSHQGSRLRSVCLRVFAGRQERQGRFRDSEDDDKIAPDPVAPVTVIRPSFEMMCKGSRIFGGEDFHYRPLDQRLLTAGELAKTSHEFIRVPDLPWQALRPGDQPPQKLNRVLSGRNLSVPAASSVLCSLDDALLELSVQHEIDVGQYLILRLPSLRRS